MHSFFARIDGNNTPTDFSLGKPPMNRFTAIFAKPGVARPLIGMLHVPPLPGSPGFQGELQPIIDRVLHDAQALTAGGADALMLENFGDVPFYPGRVPAETVAMLTALAVAVRKASPLPLGINVLRNDGLSALAVAVASGAQFIRVNVLCSARLTDQGLISGIAHDLLRLRRQLAAEHVAVLADVDVKHSAALATRPLQEEARDLTERGLADALIVSGDATGDASDPAHLTTVCEAVPGTPVLVGSGAAAENVATFAQAGGFIVGTALKHGGHVQAAIDVDRVAAFRAALDRLPPPA